MVFSVLIAHYNNSRFLAEAINSVLKQSYQNWEIILVDDASTDNFLQTIEPFRNDKRIKIYFNSVNCGCGATKRRCAELATGNILGFLDPDDVLRYDALDVMLKAHLENADCSLISSTHYICNEQLDVSRISEYTKPLPAGVPYLLAGDGSIHHFASFKKDLYKKTTGISAGNKKAVDQDLYYKLEETGNVYFVNVPLYYYRIHNGAISNAGQGKAAKKFHYAIIKEACLRRIEKLNGNDKDTVSLRRKYKTRYHKIKIVESFANRQWGAFLFNLAIYPFKGGTGHIFTYMKKILKGELTIIRKSFSGNDEVKFISEIPEIKN